MNDYNIDTVSEVIRTFKLISFKIIQFYRHVQFFRINLKQIVFQKLICVDETSQLKNDKRTLTKKLIILIMRTDVFIILVFISRM